MQDTVTCTVQELSQGISSVQEKKASLSSVAMKITMAFVASAVVVYFTGYFFEKGSIAANK